MCIVLVLYVLYTHFLVQENKIIYYLYCCLIVSSAIDISWFYSGIENFRIVSLRNTGVKLCGVILIFLLVKTPADLWKFVLINTGTDLIGQALTYLPLGNYVDFRKIKIKDAYSHHLAATFMLFIPTIAINVYTLLDQTLLGAMIEDKAYVALYKTSLNFVKTFLFFITSIGSVVMPRIANVFAKRSSHEEVNRYISSTFNLALIMAIPMIVAMACVSPYFFPWYLPGQYPIIIRLVQTVCPIIILISISDVFGNQYLVPTGRTKQFTCSHILAAIVNVIVNLLLIPKLQAVGTAIANVCAEATVVLVQWHFVKNDIEIHSFRTFIKALVSAAVMGVVVVLIGNFFGARIIGNLIQAVCGITVYVLMMLILKEETLHNLLDRFVFKRAK